MWSFRLVPVIAGSAFLLFILFAQSAFAGDFREATWAMSKAQVKTVEAAEFKFEETGKLVFGDRLFGRSVRIEYEFWSGKLLSGSYSFDEDLHRSVILQRLRAKYGPTVRQRAFPGYRRYWFESPLSYIALETKYEFITSLTYTSKAVLELRDQASEKNL